MSNIRVSKENIILKENGDVVEFVGGVLQDTTDHIDVDQILIDGKNQGDIGDLVLIDYEEGRYRSIYAKDVETVQEDLPSNPLPITVGEISQNFYFDSDYNYPLTKENCKVGDFFQQENENGVLKI